MAEQTAPAPAQSDAPPGPGPRLHPATLEAAYSRWSVGSLASLNYRYGGDVFLAVVAAIATAVATPSNAIFAPIFYFVAVAVWRVVRLALWVVAGRPWRPEGTLLWVGFMLGFGHAVGQVILHRDSSTILSDVGYIFLSMFVGIAAAGIASTAVMAVWIRLTRTATREGKKFVLFAIVIGAVAASTWIAYQHTLPDPIAEDALNQTGGMALFVSDQSADATMQVVPVFGNNGITDDGMTVALNFDTETSWALQLSGGWVTRSLDVQSGSATLLQNRSLFDADDNFAPVGGDSSAVKLPETSGGFTAVQVRWIANGTKQVITGSGDATFDLKLVHKDVSNSGGSVSAAWAPVGCAGGITKVLAEQYLSDALPAGVMALNGKQLWVPAKCDVILGGLADTVDLFPEFASSPLTLNTSIGWEENGTSPTLAAAQATAKAAAAAGLEAGHLSLGPTDQVGDLTVGSRQLRLNSAHNAGIEAAHQTLYVGIFGTALGASVVIIDLLLTNRWSGLFQLVGPPRPPPTPAEPPDPPAQVLKEPAAPSDEKTAWRLVTALGVVALVVGAARRLMDGRRSRRSTEKP